MRDKLYSDMISARKEKNKELLSAVTFASSEITATEKVEKLEKLSKNVSGQDVADSLLPFDTRWHRTLELYCEVLFTNRRILLGNLT